MAIRVILTYQKQENSGEFIEIPENVINLLEQYKAKGRLLDYSKEQTKDKVTYTINWPDHESKTMFRSEKEVLKFADVANKHNFDNTIISTLDEFFV